MGAERYRLTWAASTAPMFTAALGWRVTTRDDFQRLAAERLNDAMALLEAERFGAAYYLAGYALECALKARIALHFSEATFPDRALVQKVYTHSLDTLINLAGLKDEFEKARRARPGLDANWDIVQQWSEAARYGRFSRAQATELIRAIGEFNEDGVMAWLTKL
jgi:hypothetical protein